MELNKHFSLGLCQWALGLFQFAFGISLRHFWAVPREKMGNCAPPSPLSVFHPTPHWMEKRCQSVQWTFMPAACLSDLSALTIVWVTLTDQQSMQWKFCYQRRFTVCHKAYWVSSIAIAKLALKCWAWGFYKDTFSFIPAVVEEKPTFGKMQEIASWV